MKTFKAVMKRKIVIDSDVYDVGSLVTLQESSEYAPALFIVKDGQPTRDMLTNDFGKVFEIVEELEQAA